MNLHFMCILTLLGCSLEKEGILKFFTKFKEYRCFFPSKPPQRLPTSSWLTYKPSVSPAGRPGWPSLHLYLGATAGEHSREVGYLCQGRVSPGNASKPSGASRTYRNMCSLPQENQHMMLVLVTHGMFVLKHLG